MGVVVVVGRGAVVLGCGAVVVVGGSVVVVLVAAVVDPAAAVGGWSVVVVTCAGRVGGADDALQAPPVIAIASRTEPVASSLPAPSRRSWGGRVAWDTGVACTDPLSPPGRADRGL